MNFRNCSVCYDVLGSHSFKSVKNETPKEIETQIVELCILPTMQMMEIEESPTLKYAMMVGFDKLGRVYWK